MALTEDLGAFLTDFGVTVTSGAVSGVGILDMPGQVLAGDMIISTDYRLTVRTSEFGGLIYGAAVTADGVNYQVREALKIDDGQFTELMLTRLAPESAAAGQNPATFGLSDLSDVDVTGAVTGDQLTYDGTEWVDANSTALIDTATPGVIYAGTSIDGNDEAAPIWTIVRSLFNAAGVLTGTGTATNVTWTGRAGHTYT
jgi:hypothetical protein